MVGEWTPPTRPPPEVGRDPLQILIDGDRFFAFGDATRLGLRAVDVRSIATGERIGRYTEPRAAIDVAAHGTRVLVAGPRGGLYGADETRLLVPEPDAAPGAREATAAAFTDDGRWALATEQGAVTIEGRADAIATNLRLWSGALLADPAGVFVAGVSGAGFVGATFEPSFALSPPRLPPGLTRWNGSIVVGAPERSALDVIDQSRSSVIARPWPSEGALQNAAAWRAGLPRRLLDAEDGLLVELRALSGESKLLVGVEEGVMDRSVDLPPGTYRDLAVRSGRAYVIASQPERYGSSLLVVDLVARAIVSHESWSGAATALAATAHRLYVADADGALRVYGLADEATDPVPQLLGIIVLPEEAP